MPKKGRVRYEDDLRDRLTDPAYAVAYLNAALEDEEDAADEVFLLALRDVAAAFKMSRLADEAGVNRENLYRMLSSRGNPKFSSLLALLKALGMRLSVRQTAVEETAPVVEPVAVRTEIPEPMRFSPGAYKDFTIGESVPGLSIEPGGPGSFPTLIRGEHAADYAHIA